MRFGRQPPYPSREPFDTNQAIVAEVAPLLPVAAEQQVHPEHVGPHSIHVLVGVHDVAPALAHLRPVLDQQPVQDDSGERLGERDQPQAVQGPGHEPGVQVMPDHVLPPARVPVHRQQAAREVRVPRPVVHVRGRIPQEVPGRVQEGVRDVGLATGRTVAVRTGGVDEIGHGRQR